MSPARAGWVYDRCETTDVAVALEAISAPDFGGGSVTMPLKVLSFPSHLPRDAAKQPRLSLEESAPLATAMAARAEVAIDGR